MLEVDEKGELEVGQKDAIVGDQDIRGVLVVDRKDGLIEDHEGG